jgi:hypothetical protein
LARYERRKQPIRPLEFVNNRLTSNRIGVGREPGPLL